MGSSYFFDYIDRNTKTAKFIDSLYNYANENKKLVYALDRPLIDQKYSYNYSDAIIILSPKHKIAIINYGADKDQFDEYLEDVYEDLASISDKYDYKKIIGRKREWIDKFLVQSENVDTLSISDLMTNTSISDDYDVKLMDLLISLFVGSINDADRIKKEVPTTTLDRVKQKIQLFDGDQTRFIYKTPTSKVITIQGMSGTGKTELLLHKLKELYTTDIESKIFLTCHNKILADSLRKRIPVFFNFMKVEQQIEWNERFWCTNAWGGMSDTNSGAYRYICGFYGIPFYNYGHMSFEKACDEAIKAIKAKFEEAKNSEFALTYMLIDESQDFEKSFFDLCELVTEKNVYIAGDIFQSIFDENILSTISPDFLLGKCYRTDPKTLMFAHALGMGLFEAKKLRWLEADEWTGCGYNVNIDDAESECKYILSREPLRRFEDLEEDFESIKIVHPKVSYSDTVINVITEIQKENPSVSCDDIGVIFLDSEKDMYKFADELEIKLVSAFDWNTNKAYETKEKIADSIFISNKNNVKGLEFPFVVCISKKIKTSLSYRNSLYTMLSRSFIKSYFIIPDTEQAGFTSGMRDGLREIISTQKMSIIAPSEEEKESIRTEFQSITRLSYYETMMLIFKSLKVNKSYHDQIFKAAQQFNLQESDRDTLEAFVLNNLKFIKN